ncbi:Phosphatidylinositol 4-kinase gamma 4 [Hondaea fermentalgiana]|uniref:Phosphatidylinositol 4-kinase gamma 4 n=1 Tax=Hondaea fermentalgiana TaxID=2315210 RepID=A0A2R5GR95_9STRA|nr:Phosphatidylinositol 4-kinase gamma 4 [Hondaea fermentalgiana]|eukprot:GBG33370.1 Phosphatidylinositol 4-kinase gamma 4 [Hondaea fermentalgiana]
MLVLSQVPATAGAPSPSLVVPMAMPDHPEIDRTPLDRDLDRDPALRAAFAIVYYNKQEFLQSLHKVIEQVSYNPAEELKIDESCASSTPFKSAIIGGMDDLLCQVDVASAERADNGTSEVYFLADDAGQRKVVFKPAVDAETERAAINEQAAYLLDRGLAGVPKTALGSVKLGAENEETFGSAQAFVPGEDATDYGANVFAKDDVHRIGVLDARILNRDRHAGNLMMTQDKRLVPIDHALSFPDVNGGELADVSSEVFFYPQAKEPFSEELLAEIAAINVDEDLDLLQDAGVAEESQLGVWMSTVLLQKAAAKGKTLFEIGSMLVRPGDRTQPSVLETLSAEAMAQGTEQFFEAFNNLVDAALV